MLVLFCFIFIFNSVIYVLPVILDDIMIAYFKAYIFKVTHQRQKRRRGRGCLAFLPPPRRIMFSSLLVCLFVCPPVCPSAC